MKRGENTHEVLSGNKLMLKDNKENVRSTTLAFFTRSRGAKWRL